MKTLYFAEMPQWALLRLDKNNNKGIPQSKIAILSTSTIKDWLKDRDLLKIRNWRKSNSWRKITDPQDNRISDQSKALKGKGSNSSFKVGDSSSW